MLCLRGSQRRIAGPAEALPYPNRLYGEDGFTLKPGRSRSHRIGRPTLRACLLRPLCGTSTSAVIVYGTRQRIGRRGGRQTPRVRRSRRTRSGLRWRLAVAQSVERRRSCPVATPDTWPPRPGIAAAYLVVCRGCFAARSLNCVNVLGQVVEFPPITIDHIRRRALPSPISQARGGWCGGGDPAVVIDRAIAEHLKILGLACRRYVLRPLRHTYRPCSRLRSVSAICR